MIHRVWPSSTPFYALLLAIAAAISCVAALLNKSTWTIVSRLYELGQEIEADLGTERSIFATMAQDGRLTHHGIFRGLYWASTAVFATAALAGVIVSCVRG